MKKITDYRLAYPAQGEVKTLLAEGWQPYGSPLMSTNNLTSQAMVKYAPGPGQAQIQASYDALALAVRQDVSNDDIRDCAMHLLNVLKTEAVVA